MDNQEAVPPKQPTSPTFQQQQQHHSSCSSNNISSSPGSPRRRKSPIDLDAALYLQSQAALVQEPNTTQASTSSGQSTTVSAPIISTTPTTTSKTFSSITSVRNNSQSNLITTSNFNIQNTHQLQSQSQANLPVLTTNIRSTSTRQQLSTPLRVNNKSNIVINNSNNYRRSFNRFQTSSSTFRALGTYNDHYYKTDHSNEISVDYIDCVSNNDLTNTNKTMKGIPHCKKHLRFHRNRIDPSNNNNSNNITNIDNDTSSSSRSDPMCANQQSSARCIETSSITTTINSEEFSQSQYEGHQQNQQQSVLYPIPINDVKKRTYFADSLNQDSLLGPDELHRYFPTGRVNIFISTWNQNRKRAPMNLNDLLLPDQLINMPDIYAIAIQEAFSSQADYLKEWEIELQTTLGPNHVLLHSCSLGVLHLALFVRRDLIWFCSTPEESVYNSRSMPTNMIKTKGSVSIAFRFFGTSFMFTNCHFPAHENRLKDRIDEYQKIIKSIDLPKDLKLLKPRYLSNDSTARFDCVFFLGDLNFRLEHRTFDETINIMDDIVQQKERSYEPLTQNDELIKVMESGQAFHGFDESPIKFPPTYKFLAQTNKYDKQSKRVPSYTDRILFRSKRQRHIQCLLYDWLPQLLSSDHKPVYCLFSVLIRPGNQLNNMVKTLNAGLFQRHVYLEALKRRTEDPDGLMEKDGATGGNVICSVS